MPRPSTTEVGTIARERVVLESPFFRVVERIVRLPDGAMRAPHLLWDRTGKRFCVVIPFRPDGSLIMVEEPKFGVMQRMLSFPAGGVRKEESVDAAAARELLEETGYVATSLRVLETPLADFCDKIDGGQHAVCIAHGVTQARSPAESSQRVMVVGEEVLLGDLIRTGRVPAISMAAYLLAKHA